MTSPKQTPWGGKFRPLREKIGSSGQISHLEVSINDRCNISCKSCPIPQKSQNSISPRLIDRFEGFRGTGAKVLVLYGKEPLLEPEDELIAFMREATSEGLRCVVASNGTLLTPTLLEAFEEASVVLFIKFWGSANSYARLIHNGAKVFHAVKDNLELLQHYPRIKTYLQFLYCDQSATDLQYFWAFCHNRNFTPFVETPILTPEQWAAGNISLEPGRYLRDIYFLSLFNLRECLHAPETDWYPPFGSNHPFPCTKHFVGMAFIDVDGDAYCCSSRMVRLTPDPNGLRPLDVAAYLGDRVLCLDCPYYHERLCHPCIGKISVNGSPAHRCDPFCFLYIASQRLHEAAQFMAPAHHAKLIAATDWMRT